MIEHVIEQRGAAWVVLIKNTGVVVEVHAHEQTAREKMHALNGRQLRSAEGPMISARDTRDGKCTCVLGVFFAPPCPIAGHRNE